MRGGNTRSDMQDATTVLAGFMTRFQPILDYLLKSREELGNEKNHAKSKREVIVPQVGLALVLQFPF